MSMHKAVAIAAALAFCAGAAQAQTTLGEIMDKGFKRVEKAEFLSVILGATISGVNRSGVESTGQYRPDGTLSGTWRHPNMSQGVISGTWKLEDSGRICVVTTTGGAPTTTCFFFFRNGSQFYYAASDTDRSSGVQARSVTK